MKGFAGTIIKDTWTITRGGGVEMGGRWGEPGWWGGVGGKAENYLNNNKKCLKIKKKTIFLVLWNLCLLTDNGMHNLNLIIRKYHTNPK